MSLMVLQRVLRQATITAQVFDVLTDLGLHGIQRGTTGYLARIRPSTRRVAARTRVLLWVFSGDAETKQSRKPSRCSSVTGPTLLGGPQPFAERGGVSQSPLGVLVNVTFRAIAFRCLLEKRRQQIPLDLGKPLRRRK